MTKARGCLVWIIRIIGVVLLLIAILAIVGSQWEQRAQAQFAEQYPPVGELYNVSSYAMHMVCAGEGSPTVILDAGLGGWSIDFRDLQDEIATVTQVCAYDREGYGWSRALDGGGTAQHIVNDLSVLLLEADISEPVILVGFSYTGLSSRLFTIQNPDRVAGLILLDPAHENDNDMFSDELLQQQQALVGMYGFFGTLARFGVVRLLNPEEMAPYAPFIPQGNSEEYYASISNPKWWFTSQEEFSAQLDGTSARQVREAGDLPSDLPLVVIAAGVYPEGIIENIEEQRLASLESLVAQSEQGELIIAEGSDHEAMIERSDLIVPAIEGIIEAMLD